VLICGGLVIAYTFEHLQERQKRMERKTASGNSGDVVLFLFVRKEKTSEVLRKVKNSV
jgi:hypothetical protein